MSTHPDPLLTITDVLSRLAEEHGQVLAEGTWRSYVTRGHAPKPDRTVGRTPQWRTSTIDAWARSRPGQGSRSDLAEWVPMPHLEDHEIRVITLRGDDQGKYAAEVRRRIPGGHSSVCLVGAYGSPARAKEAAIDKALEAFDQRPYNH